MTRAQWFVTRGRGHWARARTDSQCDCVGRFGPCLGAIAKGAIYLATDLPKFPSAPSGSKKAFIRMRYCAHCADQEIPA